MKYFPISIDTKDKTILVLGGGSLATSKIKILLNSQFKIYCISDDFTKELLELKDQYQDRILLKGRILTEDFVFFGYDYCVIATGDSKLNQALADRAKRSQIEFYRADNIGESTFKFNDIVENGGLSVSILSEGLSEPVQKQIATDIENVLFKYDVEKLSLLNSIKTILVLRNHPNIGEEIEKLSKSNVAVIKNYLDTLNKTNPDIVEEFINDGKESLEEKNKSPEDQEENLSPEDEKSSDKEESIKEDQEETKEN
ncbi:MAG: NAD(P)-dependent oxidoreductase [Bacillota bacterium]|nr:NAD(P)-dependent oxidoreductase [Bacillota bacterium]